MHAFLGISAIAIGVFAIEHFAHWLFKHKWLHMPSRRLVNEMQVLAAGTSSKSVPQRVLRQTVKPPTFREQQMNKKVRSTIASTRTVRKRPGHKKAGAFGDYFYLGNGVGVKVIRGEGFKTVAKLKNSKPWKDAEYELSMLKFAEPSGITPKPFRLKAVRTGRLYYPGIFMEHIRARRWVDCKNLDQGRFEGKGIYSYVHDKMTAHGISHSDLHNCNILLKVSKNEIKKVFVIDFGPNCVRRIK